MTAYEAAVALWQRKKINTDAELAEDNSLKAGHAVDMPGLSEL